MKNNIFLRSGSVVAVSVSLVLPAGSQAAIDKFDPYAYASAFYDSNLFRVSDDLGIDKEDDRIVNLGAGFQSDWKLSRQHLLFDADVARVEYDNQNQLDHTQVIGRGTWAWEVGNLWAGNLGADYERRLASFNERDLPEKDMRTKKIGYFDARYKIHPDWRLVAGVSASDISYQKQERLDRESISEKIAVQYSNTRNSYVGVRVKYTQNDLRDDVILGNTISNDYDEVNISGVFSWEGTEKSTFEADFGYTTLNYDQLDQRDFDGYTGTLIYHWAVTAKTRFNISAWRETSTLTDEIAEYVLTQGASISPSWSVTPLITLGGTIRYANDDFKGTNDIVAALGGERREDDTWLYAISATWTPRQYLSLSIGYRREKRDSTVDVHDFEDDQANARIQMTF